MFISDAARADQARADQADDAAQEPTAPKSVAHCSQEEAFTIDRAEILDNQPFSLANKEGKGRDRAVWNTLWAMVSLMRPIANTCNMYNCSGFSADP
jgi:hypothetical protein